VNNEELMSMVGTALASIVSNLGTIAGVPRDTGNLHASIKLRNVGDAYEVYIDTDQAPYAGSVNERSQYWRRVAIAIQDQLKLALGDTGPTRYDSGLTARGGNSE
jgi:hypothetical protein